MKLSTNVLIVFVSMLAITSGVHASHTRKEHVHKPLKIIHPPKIDGQLDEAEWQQAHIIDSFVQREPQEGHPASESTEVRILYDEKNIYFGIVCHDSQPQRIVANEMRRDAPLLDDDYIEIFLDTYHDHRNAFYFMVNPVGARRDAQIRNEGSQINWNWDGIWRVKTRIHKKGWTAEIVIPFYTLRFKQTQTQSWGLNLGRQIARRREDSYWSPILRSMGWFGKFMISYCGHLEGLEGLQAGKRIQIMPYVIGGGIQEDENEDFEATGDMGLDLKYRLTANLTADLTLNTDFAQVEADQEVFNLTRFNLFFPEKRPFFLENADVFRVGARYRPEEPPSTLLFFSRTIGLSEDNEEIPILGGLRVTGKSGSYDIGIMDIITDRLYSSEDADQLEVGRTNQAILRLRRDFLKKSNLGIMYLDKYDMDSRYNNRVAAFDFNLAFGQAFQSGGFVAKSSTPGAQGGDWAFYADCFYNDQFWFLDASYTDIGENFKSDMGFIPRIDIRKFNANLGLGPRPQVLNIRQIFFFNQLTYIENHAGRLDSRTNLTGAFTQFQNGSQLFLGFSQNYEFLSEEFEIKEDVFIPMGSYDFNLAFAFFQSDKSRKLALRAETNAGQFYNGHLFRLNMTGFLKLSRHFHIEFLYDRNQFDLPVEGGKFFTNIAASRFIYSFSPDLYTKAYLQWNSTEDLLRADFLVRWIYKPGANIFFIYNETRRFGKEGAIQDRAIMLKVTFLFNY